MPDFTENDRKLITEHSVKLTQVCKKIDRLIDKVDENVKTYITKRMFCWVNGFIIILVISLFGYFATVNNQVISNSINIENIQKIIER